MSWKEARKNNKKTPKKEVLKPFSIRHFRFFPCCWSKSVKSGFQYYLAVRRHRGYFMIPELDSPRFKSKEEAKEYVENFSDLSLVPA